MRYAKIDECENCNGIGNGISLFIQCCHFHCSECFNQEAWDFNGGQEWTNETEKAFLELANRSYIKRISILGGEPLEEENLDSVLELLKKIRIQFGNTKTIWLYTGYQWQHIFDNAWHYHPQTQEKLLTGRWRRQNIIKLCDVLVDGRYIDEERDITLPWRGSQNQNVIDIQKSIEQGRIIPWIKNRQ